MMNLPAYEFMRSEHDLAVHTARRYTVNLLKKKLLEAGFEIKVLTYRNTVLFPLAFASRMAQKVFSRKKGENENPAHSDLKQLPAVVNSFFAGILKSENSFIENNIKLPFGLSVFCVAEKVL
jgi:hypothetical protein